jgi:hypothetical protein
MAYVRQTGTSFGLYEKYRDPETARQKERCLCRFGQYPDAWSAYHGYRTEIADAWQRVRHFELLHSIFARHERWMAQGVIMRLGLKVDAVVDYILGQQPDAKVRKPRYRIYDAEEEFDDELHEQPQ